MSPPTPRPEPARPSAARRSPAARRAQRDPRAFLRWTLWVFIAAAMLALLADMRAWRRRLASARDLGRTVELDQRLRGPVYSDRDGYFHVEPPCGWTAAQPNDLPYQVVFYGPDGMDISIMAGPSSYATMAQLMRRIGQIETELSANTHIGMTVLGGRAVIRRTCQLFRSKLLLLDFVEDGIAHHIQFSAPPALFDRYESAVMDVLNSYQPGAGRPAAAGGATASPAP